MKCILLPIHPEWCCKLMNGDKETEVRRGTALYNAIDRLIKEQGKAPCLIYCTKGKEKLFDNVPCVPRFRVSKNYRLNNYLNGKVVAMFEAQPDRIFNVRYGADEDECAREHRYVTSLLGCEELERSSCLEYDQLLKYLGREWDDGYIGTAIHVKQGSMKTDGFPKELRVLFTRDKNSGIPKFMKSIAIKRIEKAPQSWCYAEVGK